MRKDKAKLVNQAIENLENMILALKDIQSGNPECQACIKYNINKNSLRHIVFDGERIFQKKKQKNVEIEEKNFLTPAEKLYVALMGSDKNIPYDVEETICYCLSHSSLSNIQIKVLRMRFWENKTLEEIGNVVGVTRERVRQIEVKALQNIRKYNHGILKYGAFPFLKHKIQKKENGVAQKEILLLHLRELEKKEKEQAKEEERLREVVDYVPKEERTIMEWLKTVNASVRLENVLRRRGIKGESISEFPLKNLDGFSRQVLLDTRGMGKGTMKELEFLLKKEGITLGE